MDQARAAQFKEDLEATTPIREAQDRCVNKWSSPRQAFRFVGDGPFYEFTLSEWTGFSSASALNYFHRIGATVVTHERRPWVFSEDGKTYYSDYFLVKWVSV